MRLLAVEIGHIDSCKVFSINVYLKEMVELERF